MTGPVTVATVNGTATSAQEFQVLTVPAPVVTTFAPSSGPPGTMVDFQGSGLVNVTNVAFNGVNAQFSTLFGFGSPQASRRMRRLGRSRSAPSKARLQPLRTLS